MMPLYEFVCRSCKEHFEALVSIGKEKDVNCPVCGGTQIQKCISSFGIGGTSKKTTSSSASCSSCSATSCSTCG